MPARIQYSVRSANALRPCAQNQFSTTRGRTNVPRNVVSAARPQQIPSANPLTGRGRRRREIQQRNCQPGERHGQHVVARVRATPNNGKPFAAAVRSDGQATRSSSQRMAVPRPYHRYASQPTSQTIDTPATSDTQRAWATPGPNTRKVIASRTCWSGKTKKSAGRPRRIRRTGRSPGRPAWPACTPR